jgi:hypothetical protein
MYYCFDRNGPYLDQATFQDLNLMTTIFVFWSLLLNIGRTGYKHPVIINIGRTGYKHPVIINIGRTGYKHPVIINIGRTGYKHPVSVCILFFTSEWIFFNQSVYCVLKISLRFVSFLFRFALYRCPFFLTRVYICVF